MKLIAHKHEDQTVIFLLSCTPIMNYLNFLSLHCSLLLDQEICQTKVYVLIKLSIIDAYFCGQHQKSTKRNDHHNFNISSHN